MNSTAPNQERDNAEILSMSGADLARHFIQQALMAAAALPGGEADPQTSENGLECGAGLTVEEASDIIRGSLGSAVDALDGVP